MSIADSFIMGRRKSNKIIISSGDRARMFREREKIRRRENERMAELLQTNHIHTIAYNSAAQVNENQFDLRRSNNEPHLKEKLRRWTCENRIAKRAVDGLLLILNDVGIKSLPKNHRTLQQTPTNIEINDIAGGQLWYNGLAKCLRNIFSNLDRDITIELNFNIDGLPIFNSSKLNFYPILSSIHGTVYHFIFNFQ